MKRFIVTLVIGLLLIVSQTMAAQVTNIDLSHQDGTTFVRVDVSGQVRYTHDTEIPKNGKPDRIILDILSARHDLGAKSFLELPACGVKGIRTSQFAVTPEEIVRVVVDLDQSPIYQVDSDDKSVTIQIADKNAHAFKSWSTAAYLAASKAKPAQKAQPAMAKKEAPKQAAPAMASKTVKQQNKSIESDRQLSLAGKEQPNAKAAPKKEVTKPAAKQSVAPPKKTVAARPANSMIFGKAKLSTPDDAPKAQAPKKAPAVKKADKPVLAKAEVPKKAVEQAAPKAAPKKTSAVKKSEKPVLAKTEVPIAASKKAAPAKAPVVKKADKPVLAKAEAPKEAAKAQTPSKAPAKVAPPKVKPTEGQVALAKKVAGDKPSSQKPINVKDTRKEAAPEEKAVAEAPQQDKRRSASRFRRKAGVSAKIAGTMVAEFPKRLVIKYNSKGHRDPFATLIDDTRTYNVPIEKRVPNVEGLKLVGVIESEGTTNRALFEDKEGYSFMLNTGDKVKNGYVLRVESDRVYFQVFEYGWSRTIALKMD